MGLGRKTAKSAAGLLAGAMLLSGLTAPTAFAGGGGGNRPGQGGNADVTQFWQYKDDETGSWGSASNIDSVVNAMNAAGVTMNDKGRATAQAALNDARNECEAGFKQRHPNEGDGDCRVVAVGAVPIVSSGGYVYDGTGWYGKEKWLENWNTYVAPAHHQYNGAYDYTTSTPFTDDPSNSVDTIMKRNVEATSQPSLVIIVLDKYQPAPPNYNLTVTTDQQAGADVRVGGTSAVHDLVHASNDRGTVEDLTATVELHFDGNDWTGAKSVSKSVKITSQGDTRSPDFTPGDFGWKVWENGSYWFDVKVSKQGRMANAVDTADREQSESWSVPPYALTVTTQQQAAKAMKVGDTSAVKDRVIASHDGDPKWSADLDAKIVLHYDGQPDGYVAAGRAEKTFTIVNNGTTDSPGFTPADLGMKHWQEGTYWFDVQVARQKNMKAAVDTADREASETWTVSAEPPGPPAKTIDEGVSADGMTNRTVIRYGTGKGGYEMTLKDRITANGVDYTVGNYRLVDKTDGRDVSGEFTIAWDREKNVVSAVRTADKGEMPLDHEFEFSFDVNVSRPKDFRKVKDSATGQWNREPEADAGSKEFDTWQPNPDKSWIIERDGEWQAVIDPQETNRTGGDAHTYLDGDKVGSVVNGTVGRNLIQAPTKFVLTDDWTAADYIFDADTRNIRVYEAEAGTDRESSVSDIVNAGRDVTDQFDITVEGTKAAAKAKASYLKGLKGLKNPKQVTLLIPGRINFAGGKGAEQVRKDFGKEPGDELTFCTAPDGKDLTNGGSETVNGHTEATNEPRICGYVPPVRKDVVSEASQGGDQESVQGKVVQPGQKVEYQLNTQPQLPSDLAYEVRSVSFTDAYDAYLKPDKQTLEMMDLNTGKPVSKKKYTTTWDDSKHMFTLTVTDRETIGQWRAGTSPRLQVRFEGTVADDAPTDHKIGNKWVLTLNNSLTPSNEVFNIPPKLDPVKQVTQKDATISIDGKTALLGDEIYYRVTLDARQDDQAYAVWRLGMVDDYDDEYLKLDVTKVEITDETGRDVTDRFNIQDRDGVLYAYAKLVDTEIPATGETVKGDPQPADLKAYSESDEHDPLTQPAIDQGLLGHTYTVSLPMTVVKVTDGYTVRNKAVQVLNRLRKDTNEVSNPLKPLNPAKDVTVKVGGESVSGRSIYKGRTFLYQLDSSILPTNRAYPQVTEWHIVDSLDPAFDEYTGQWAVYATRDLYRDGKLLASKGERIAGSGFDGSKFGGDLFILSASVADGRNVVTIEATERYRTLVSDDSHEAGWRAYIQVRRVKATDRHENRFTETLNGKPTDSNVVWTRTPDMTPSLKVEKWDRKSGWPDGDRDSSKDALTVSGDTEIVFTITNTSRTDPDTGQGAVFRTKDLKLEDTTVVGDGRVTDLKYPDDWDTGVLRPGESVEVTGTLKGVTKEHTDRAKVSGTPLMECPVDDETPFDAASKSESDADGGTGQGTENAEATAEGKDSATASTADLKRVTVQGATLCEDTAVESATDDWNGKRAQLASTGATVMWLMAVTLLLAGASAASYTLARRASRPRHGHASGR